MKTIFSVSQVNRYVKKALEADALLAGLFVAGELSNVNAHSSGHLYFTLKDETAAVGAVMFKGAAMDLTFVPKSGMKVVAFGRLSLFEKTGQYQFYAEFLEETGAGEASQAFNALKEKLLAEGLFDAAKKREIPQYAQTVAVITSPTGAAVRDIIKTIQERNPAVKILLCPAIVQGENAPADLIRALHEVNEFASNGNNFPKDASVDVIILGRGGGSAEDLSAFNDETLVRAVAASKIPVISAVGHETDFSLTDFAADSRAATPTAAAQAAVYDLVQVAEYLRDLQAALKDATFERIRSLRTRLADCIARLNRATTMRLVHERQNLTHLEEILEKISPYAVFKRGFAITQCEGKTIASVKSLSPGQNIKITYADGSAFAEITDLGGVAPNPPQGARPLTP